MARRRARRLAPVRAMPGSARPEDAAKFVNEAAHTGRLLGAVVGLVYRSDDGTDVTIKVCGEVTNGDLVWIGAKLFTGGSWG